MIVDLSAVPPAVRAKMEEIFRRDYDLRAMRAIENQRRIAAFHYRHSGRPVGGLAQDMALDRFIDWYWRRKRGQDVWDDDDFRNWFRRRHEEVRVRTGPLRPSVGYDGVAAVRSGERRFVKRYG